MTKSILEPYFVVGTLESLIVAERMSVSWSTRVPLLLFESRIPPLSLLSFYFSVVAGPPLLPAVRLMCVFTGDTVLRVLELGYLGRLCFTVGKPSIISTIPLLSGILLGIARCSWAFPSRCFSLN